MLGFSQAVYINFGWDLITFGDIRLGINRNKVPQLIVRYESPWQKVIQFITAIQLLLCVNTADTGFFNSIIPELSFCFERGSPDLGGTIFGLQQGHQDCAAAYNLTNAKVPIP